ncbi:MAG: RagB/SusD family nutrient uptake outer membrane protein [Ferruginibacter sp.]
MTTLNKKIIFLFSVGFAFIMTSCKRDFLELSPQGLLTDEAAATDPQIARKLVTGVYNQLYQGGFGNDVHGIIFCMATDVASDDADKGSTLSDQAPEAVGFDNFTSDLNANNFYVDRLWAGHYKGIAAANGALDVLSRSTFDNVTTRTLIGETRFLRAYFYFNLVRLFGDVPKVLRVPSGPVDGNSDEFTTRAPRDSIYAAIISDLQFAADSLPSRGSTDVGRIDKGAAQSLLSKVYLYTHNYQGAYDLSTEVINSGKYGLMADYSRNFRTKADDNNFESVFEIQTGTNVDCNAAIPFYTVAQGPRSGGLGGWADLGFGLNTPSVDLANAYEPGDLRDSVTIIYIKPDSTVLWDGFVVPARNRVQNDRYNYKAYFGRKTETYCNTGNTDQLPKNVHIIRFAEVLLINAEAGIQIGNVSQAQTDLDLVRLRAGLASVTATTTNIWNERRTELAMEQDRFFDLVRQGRAGIVLRALGKNFVDGKNEVFPIPQPQIDLSAGKLTQNNGY